MAGWSGNWGGGGSSFVCCSVLFQIIYAVFKTSAVIGSNTELAPAS
jgi:hypothetical protein